jgi:hypothetical protein
MPGAYVIVLTPPHALTKEVVAGMELPFDARQFLELANDQSLPSGSLFGLVRPDHAEWHQLADVASVTHVLSVWKRAGEDAVVTLRVRDGRAEIAGIE